MVRQIAVGFPIVAVIGVNVVDPNYFRRGYAISDLHSRLFGRRVALLFEPDRHARTREH